MKAGDKLAIREGTYNEVINTQAIPTGTSSSPVTITAYSGETVTLKPSSGYAAIQIVGNSRKYITFNRLIIDAANTTDYAVNLDGVMESGAGHIRFTNCEIRNAPRSGVLIGRRSNFNEFINCNIHDNGRDGVSYGLYIQSSNNLIEGGKIHHNSGYGVHIYNGYSGQRANNNVIRKNLVYSNCTNDPESAGILIGSGDGNMASNNMCITHLLALWWGT